MNKYIIKNCPLYVDNCDCSCCNLDIIGEQCKNNTDCLLKRIVDKAKNASPYNFLTEDILRMLEIEEYEE